ncbi:copper chaperone [Ascosphaera acerosa]|nr:copper chaperone [Ascosphaera acerosa]
MVAAFETTYAVPMTCESCINDVQGSLGQIAGIERVSADLDSQLVSVLGSVAPSAIIRAIQETGRDAILRGSGTGNNAAVCILETHAPGARSPVRGLARMVQVADRRTVVDLTLRGVAEGTYVATVRETGDISRGAASTGGVWGAHEAQTPETTHAEPAGLLGSIAVDGTGRGSAFLDRPLAVADLVGRAMVLARDPAGPDTDTDANTLVGVIARSAGVWDNDKTVCSCSGKNVWEERAEHRARGARGGLCH